MDTKGVSYKLTEGNLKGIFESFFTRRIVNKTLYKMNPAKKVGLFYDSVASKFNTVDI